MRKFSMFQITETKMHTLLCGLIAIAVSSCKVDTTDPPLGPPYFTRGEAYTAFHSAFLERGNGTEDKIYTISLFEEYYTSMPEGDTPDAVIVYTKPESIEEPWILDKIMVNIPNADPFEFIPTGSNPSGESHSFSFYIKANTTSLTVVQHLRLDADCIYFGFGGSFCLTDTTYPFVGKFLAE